jgi:hypothetical protein
MLIPQVEQFPNVSEAELSAYQETGIIVFRGALRGDPVLDQFVAEASWVAQQLLIQAGADYDEAWPIDRLLTALLKVENGVLPRFLNGICSHPLKLVSGNQLKYDPRMVAVVRRLLGERAILASPLMSDALAFNLTPSLLPKQAKGLHQSLPIHQDYPYMMQSDRQVVVWIPVGEWHEGIGGIHCWLGSHKEGVRPQRKIGDYYELADTGEALDKRYPRAFVTWNKGDVVVFDSHIVHQTVPNTSASENRVVQMFRFSDLNSADAAKYYWRSTPYVDRSPVNRKAIDFNEVRPELVEIVA